MEYIAVWWILDGLEWWKKIMLLVEEKMGRCRRLYGNPGVYVALHGMRINGVQVVIKLGYILFKKFGKLFHW